MRRNVGASAGALALLAAMMYLSGPRDASSGGAARDQESSRRVHSEAPAKAREAEPASSNPQHLEGPWLATRPFFRHDSDANVVGKNGQAVDLFDEEAVVKCAEEADCRASLSEYFGASTDTPSIEFVIATVADPLHTRLALLTDATINAIEEGAASAGWEFASQWLPWNDSVNGDVSDVDKRREQRALVRAQETQPGVLVFRHQKEGPSFDNRVLIVFVLGEAPTSGVNPPQFQLARAYSKAMRGDGRSVRILGPSFSGSFYSLTKLVEWDEHELKTPSSDYVVRTGTATSGDNASAFKLAAPDFDGTNESLTDQQTHFCEVLKALNIAPDSAAFLVEGETGYGNSFSAAADPQTRQLRSNGCGVNQVFRFPREISHLRNAYREAVAASQTNGAQVPDVSFSLKDSNSGEDSVPVFSETQTPLSQNAVLAEIINQIRRNRIRIVEAGASNVLDLLFVSRLLRAQCPDTRVLVVFPDLLFVQALQTEPLNGVLSLSTYPLFFSKGLWARNARPGVTYTDMNSEGVYNALLLLLERSSSSGDRERARAAISDYRWKNIQRPPTWFMTLDRDGFAPVNVFTTTRQHNWFEAVPGAMDSLMLPRPPVTWTLLLAPFSAFSLWLTGLVVYLHSNLNSRSIGFLAPDRNQAVDSARLFFLFFGLLLLSAIQVILFSPVVFRATVQPSYGIQILAWLGILASAILALAIGIELARKPRLPVVRTALVLVASACAGAAALWIWCCYGRGDQSFFFSFRSLELRLGSSPVIPIVSALAAFTIFSAVHLMRFHLITNQRPRLFTTTFDAVLEGQLKKSRGEMNRILLAPIGLHKRANLLFTGAFLLGSLILFLLLRANVHLAAIDGQAYDALSITLQTLLTLALLLTCWHLKIIWSWFHTFLASLNTLPLARAFGRLNDGKRRSPIWARRLNLLSLDIPIRSSQTLHDMRILVNKQADVTPGVQPSEVERWAATYRTAVKKLLGNECAFERSGGFPNRWDTRRDFVHLKHLGAFITDEICRVVLLPHWRDNCILVTECDQNPPKPKPDSEESDSKPQVDAGPPLRTFYDLSQSFVALHYSAFAIYGVRQIQNLLWFLSLGFVLLTLSLNSYNYQSPRMIGRFLFVLFAAISYVGWRCLAEMERDPILSRISGSTAGELNKGFYLKLISYGALPVLGILASQFPSISKFLFSWVQPALEAIR